MKITNWDSDDWLDLSDGHMDTAVVFASFSQLCKEVFNDLSVFVSELRMTFLPCVFYVLLQLFMLKIRESWYFILQFIFLQIFHLILLGVRMVFHVGINDKCAKLVIYFVIYLILDHAENIESR